MLHTLPCRLHTAALRHAHTPVSRAAEEESCLSELMRIRTARQMTQAASPLLCIQLKSFGLSVTASSVQHTMLTACRSYSHPIMCMPTALFPVHTIIIIIIIIIILMHAYSTTNNLVTVTMVIMNTLCQVN